MTTPRELKNLYESGKNISQLLRTEKNLNHNSSEIIEIAYDLQTGSYIEAMNDSKMLEQKNNYTDRLAKIILELGEPESILEAGIGEATTLSGVLKSLNSNIKSYGFDISWSRVAYARKWLHSQGILNTTLCSGELLNIPFSDNSIDIVYTSHSIEPNGGNEEPILKELFRVTRKYLILLEPSYEMASDEAKRRMISHGYCKNLKTISESLGYQILTHELFPFTTNPLNPTAITIIKKHSDTIDSPSSIFACPKYKTPLEIVGSMLFSPEALTVYPIIDEIPCLRIQNGIFASKYT